MSKIIIATEYSSADQNSTGYYWEKIIQRLCLEGFDVELLSPDKIVHYESVKPNPSLMGKIIKQIGIAFELGLKILMKADSAAIVFTGTNPLVLLFLMPILKRLKDFKWILLCHDVFPDNLVAMKKVNEEGFIYKIIHRYFSWVYLSTDKIICIGRDMVSVMQNKTGRSHEIFYASNWVDPADVKPISRKQVECFTTGGWDEKVVFQFFGNMGPLQGIDNILEAVSRVKSKNAAFVFIGGGASVNKIKKFIRERQDLHVKYLGAFPSAKRSLGLAFCDVALVSLGKGMVGLGVPSKAYFSLAADKPLLAIVDAQSEIGLMIDEYGIGWQCEPDAPDELANKIDFICDHPHEISKMKPREVFEKNYSGLKSLDKISEIMNIQIKEMKT